ncbi:NADH-quinone oxidoreductase subunit N [bacterium]|nr:NADH-quinone oxidoreductase subunit N [bacterium]
MEPITLTPPPAFGLTAQQLAWLTPYFFVLGGSCLALLLSVYEATKPSISVPATIILAFLGGIATTLPLIEQPPTLLFGGMLIADGFTAYANILFLISAAAVTFFSRRYLLNQDLEHTEFYTLIALSALGMMIMAASTDLVMIFLGLELMSISVYVLVGFRRNDRRSNEAGIKYYILGSAASAVMLYGAALFFGATGTTNVQVGAIRAIQMGMGQNALLIAGLLCILIGFLFKIASVPFHMWMPDVYEGAPAPVTGFMTTGLKAAVFITLLRVFSSMVSVPALSPQAMEAFQNVLWVSAALTMFLGNVAALQQTNIKRMLAYSSIAHSGYLLVGLLAGPQSHDGFSAVLFYVVIYTIMNLGAFAVVSAIAQKGDTGLELNDLSGLSAKHPGLAFLLAVFLFSMAGIPPTAGFTAKYYLFYSAIQAGQVWLVVLAVLCSAIGAYYYLRVIVQLYMREAIAGSPLQNWKPSRAAVTTALAAVILVLQLGIYPAPALKMLRLGPAEAPAGGAPAEAPGH